MDDQVAEAHGPAQPDGQILGHCPGLGEAPEGVGVGRGASQAEVDAARYGEVDHDLDGLPEVQDHRVRRRRHRLQGARLLGKVLGHPAEVPEHEAAR